MKPRTPRFQDIKAFSLVEVVTALAIVAFALLPIFALLPAGLATFHNSEELYYSAQTRKEILNDLQQTDIHSLLNASTSYSQTNYFDDQGTFLGTNGTASFASTPIYQVAVTVSTQTPAGSTIVLPNASASATLPSGTAALANAVVVTTQFSRYKSVSAVTVSSAFQTNTDYLYYNNPNP